MIIINKLSAIDEQLAVNCSKCTIRATHTVHVSGKKYYSCDRCLPEERQSITDTLRANNHIINLKGKEFVLFSGLLDVAHRNGLQSLDSEIVHIDYDNMTCVHRATATGTRGTFIAHGDSSPSNTGKLVQTAFIRMSETRAYARCLRLYLGTGMCSFEELPPQ